jgi:anti-sigma regulatory factor (Ser/Thr protein kinase)
VLECRLPATASVLAQVRRSAEDAAADFGFRPGERYEFVFAVNEAVTNAIRHGRPDSQGMIDLRIDADGEALICSVLDSGTFRLLRPNHADPLAESGRGFMLMAELTDHLELATTSTGTMVRLHKRRLPDQGDPSR